jgi:hypothetical protein
MLNCQFLIVYSITLCHVLLTQLKRFVLLAQERREAMGRGGASRGVGGGYAYVESLSLNLYSGQYFFYPICKL